MCTVYQAWAALACALYTKPGLLAEHITLLVDVVILRTLRVYNPTCRCGHITDPNQTGANRYHEVKITAKFGAYMGRVYFYPVDEHRRRFDLEGTWVGPIQRKVLRCSSCRYLFVSVQRRGLEEG